jgi:tetratricopeptide (TPR) repeat protein
MKPLVAALLLFALAPAVSCTREEKPPPASATDPAKKHSWHYFVGGVFFERKDWDKAILEYTEAIKHKPDFAEAYLSRGTVYNRKKDWDSAIADLTQGIKLTPDLNPNLVTAYVDRGLAYHGKKDYDRAIEDYTQAMSNGPPYSWSVAYKFRGNAHKAKGNKAQAKADYAKAKERVRRR